ncbi:histidine phosphatase family protein [Pediococcus stilesii]|uniref:Fructose-2,6-bisphosphatase n=1 Tax=Pediococcus stilesii TaxID=331679 RepID=A0A0R2KV48_9LACO|nr:histidine phosphatase family protein [Pediococcus stilesii]KRN93377.1 fructose-2,6-bisphosphatase [Pediococcus stilesii]TLQ04265.1 histidine phosphatase family protein [Pediococcus stilesii]
MDLVIVRHSISTDNHAGRVSGAGSNVELSPAGIDYAKKVREAYDWDRFDQVFASPLRRAQQTAQILTNDSPNIKLDQRLSELHFGDWEGADEKQLFAKHPDVFDYAGMFNEKYSNFAPNSESYADLVLRSKSFLSDIIGPYANRSVLLVCHGMTIRALFAAIFNSKVSEFTTVNNVTLNEVYFDPKNNFDPRLYSYNQKLV